MESGTFCFIHKSLEQFQDQPIFFKNGDPRTLILEKSIIEIGNVYILRYDVSADTISMYHDGGKYSSIGQTTIRGNKSLIHVFELYEWLVKKLGVDMTSTPVKITTGEEAIEH